MISCMMFQNISLDNEMREALFRAAVAMCLQQEEKQPVQGDTFVGQVETSFDTALFGAIFGILFTAQIETNLGSGTVTFIVRKSDITADCGEGVWLPVFMMNPSYGGTPGTDLPN